MPSWVAERYESRCRRTLRTAAAPLEAEPGQKKSREPTLHPAVARALDSAQPAAGFPLRVMAYVFEPRAKDATRVLVAAELDASRLALPSRGQAQPGRLDLSVLITHRDSGRPFRFDGTLALTAADGAGPSWRALTREFELPAGVAQARVVVRDPASGAIGSVAQRFEVPPAGVLRLSTPILTDRDRKSTRLNSSHIAVSRMPSSA